MTNLHQFLKLFPRNFKILDYRRRSQSQIQRLSEKKLKMLAEKLVKRLKCHKLFLAAMESCTGGGLMNEITNIPGASEITKGGLITYSISEKIAQGVPDALIKKHSVYSPQVAVAMAVQAIKKMKGSQIGVGITGRLSYGLKERKKYPFDEVFLAVIYKNKFLVQRLLLAPQKSRAVAKAIIIYEALKAVGRVI